MPAVNYLRVVDCKHDAANWNESYRISHRNKDEAYEGLPIYQSIKINLQIWQIALALMSVTFGGAWCNRVVVKQEDSHSTAPVNKQINE